MLGNSFVHSATDQYTIRFRSSLSLVWRRSHWLRFPAGSYQLRGSDMLVTETSRKRISSVPLPSTPEGSHAMTQLLNSHRPTPESRTHCHSGPVFGYVLEGKTLFELEGEEPREIVAGRRHSGNLAATSCTTRLQMWTRTTGSG